MAEADTAFALTRCTHFVGFRGDEYTRACRVFGEPDFVHILWDRRARREIAPGDRIIFANEASETAVSPRNGPDIKEPLWIADARTLGFSVAEIARLTNPNHTEEGGTE